MLKTAGRSTALLLIFISTMLLGCSTTPRFQRPLDTLRAYTDAVRKKDTAEMKKYLSAATLQMHQEEAQRQGISVDDILLRETLIAPGQRSVRFRHEKIDGPRATIEVQNSFGVFETYPFVLEEGIWKLDKKGFAEGLRQIGEENDATIDDFIEQQRVEPEDTAPGTDGPASGTDSPAPPAETDTEPVGPPPPATGDGPPDIQ